MAAKSGTGLDKNVAGALSYVLGPITGVIFLVLEENSFVKFHAMQSIVISIFAIILSLILAPVFTILLFVAPLLVPLVGLLSQLFGIVLIILWFVLIYKAWQGDKWNLPVVGDLSKQLLKKIK